MTKNPHQQIQIIRSTNFYPIPLALKSIDM